MFHPMLDQFRQAVESATQLQQDLVRNWSQTLFQGAMFPVSEGTEVGNGWIERVRSLQSGCAETVTDLLNRHRELLDTQYRAGIRTIEDAFRVGEAKDPEQFRKLTEELWRQSFTSAKTLTEVPMRDLQVATEKWLAIATKSLTPAKA